MLQKVSSLSISESATQLNFDTGRFISSGLSQFNRAIEPSRSMWSGLILMPASISNPSLAPVSFPEAILHRGGPPVIGLVRPPPAVGVAAAMACLVPQFKPPPTSDAHSRPSSPSLHPKARESVWSQVRCVLSPTAALIDFEQIPKLEAHSTSLSTCAIKPLTYTGAVGLPTKTSFKATWASEALLMNEEAVIAAAAAEAVALARAALELAKDAAQMIRKSPSAQVEHVNLSETEGTGMTNHSVATETTPLEENVTLDESVHKDFSGSTYNETEVEEMEYCENIAVRSGRQTERRARRARAAEKAAAGVLTLKSGSSGKKKRSTLQEIDYSDPLHYLRGTTSTSRLLTAAEEVELSEGIQDLLKLERLQQDLAERNGCQPTFAQWAAAAGIDQKALRKRLNYGTFCKDKMITSNIRLVISIAKNYQHAGMNLQDLVQFHMVEATYRVREAKKQLYSENGRHPDHEEVAEASGLSMKRFAAVMLTPKAPRSLDQKIGINQTLKPSEVIADPDAETSEDILIKHFMREDLNKVLDTLNPREKRVVRWRFGLEDGRMKTLQEIGELMGVSRERIRQIESCAFRKLKSKKRTKNLQQYIIS
ncbi:SWIM zinc finger protein [Musa troglodytarum]|uniref:SWIM zinc finger protein n=1 Tax=Musa troglodytarum TaxID=320322 RepID=A0A9E7KCY0_9LILI|nr:SWIM zinc finger protein [Musa troglodytarum]